VLKSAVSKLPSLKSAPQRGDGEAFGLASGMTNLMTLNVSANHLINFALPEGLTSLQFFYLDSYSNNP